ncbi:MAG: GntR family transcriptional regulator [Verrucomicrobiota bacterium]|nr:GntR family transcriptional regulator [Verrucomicrobiota bacterium]
MSNAPVKVSDLVARLKGRIVDGSYPAGKRIPSCRDLEHESGASHLTVFSAMKKLGKEGFLKSKGNQGTFVVKCPPFLKNVLLLSNGGDEQKKSLFYQLFNLRIDVVARQMGRQVQRINLDVLITHPDKKADLFTDIREHQYEGAIILPHSLDFSGTPLDRVSGFPSIGVFNSSACTSLYTVCDSFYHRSAALFKKAGCRRPAILLSNPQHDAAGHKEYILRSFKPFARGMDEPHMMSFEALNPGWIGGWIRLLYSLPANHRPDGFLVTDENMVDETLKAIRTYGKVDPAQVPLIRHASLVPSTKNEGPGIAIGYDVDQICVNCFESLRLQRSEKKSVSYAMCAVGKEEIGIPEKTTYTFTCPPIKKTTLKKNTP